VRRKLAVLTGDLRDQYQKDLSQGGILDSYQQVSATTSYDVLDVGLEQINDAQDSATLVVFGKYVVTSVNSGDQAAPQGSECEVTDDGRRRASRPSGCTSHAWTASGRSTTSPSSRPADGAHFARNGARMAASLGVAVSKNGGCWHHGPRRTARQSS
jgi:hypothetical protein